MNFREIEQKWQKEWEKAKIFEVKENPKKKKFYNLEMYPYPSGKLHMGHVRNYVIGDAYARFKRMMGFNVLYPMGYDAFGLPAENAAIKFKTDPKSWTIKSIESMKQQQKMLGLSYDWTREIASFDPNYFKWNQWIFLKFLERGLAYKKKAPVNWCPKCNTVLANEQVSRGKCWRCDSEIETRELDQWFFKITEYAEELLNDLDSLEWPENVKAMQRNWIGKSEGIEIYFKLKDSEKILATFTTRPDTIYGVTYLAISIDHPLVIELTKNTEYEKEVENFIKESKSYRTLIEEKESKRGMFIGKYAVNPVTGEECPIYIADYVLLDYGTGIVMGVPAHDQRDFEFAKEHNLPIKIVIRPENSELTELKEAYVDEGILINSGEFSGMKSNEAINKISDYLEKNNFGKKTIKYRLRDWLISRQRYWGTPIPVIYCENCGMLPVPYEQLPVKLPEDVEFTGTGNPLETSEKFVNTICYKCNGKAKRETDTMDTFVDSSWYFFRYCSPKYDELPFDKDAVSYWMPVDQYIGGVEHAVMHLLYARFFTKALRDIGLHNFNEPFKRLLTQGMVLKDGFAMSKSRGNVVDPEEMINKFSVDSVRLFILGLAAPTKEFEWSDEGLNSYHKFLNKFIKLFKLSHNPHSKARDEYILSKVYASIDNIQEDYEKFNFPNVIIKLKELVNEIEIYKSYISQQALKEALNIIVLLFSPLIPHICEELWHELGNKNFVSTEKWPKVDKNKINENILELEQIFKKTLEDLRHVIKLAKKKENAYIYFATDKEFKYFIDMTDYLKSLFGFKEIKMYKVSDKEKYDPENKASRAKYGKPAIYLS